MMEGFQWMQWIRNWQTYVLLSLVALAAAVRLPYLYFESWDYVIAISKWCDTLAAEGFRAFRNDFHAPYTPLYLYMLYLGQRLFPSLPHLVVVKLVSIAFDFLTAFFAWRLVRRRYPKGLAPLLAAAAVLLAPTVIANGAVWAQCDSPYTAMLLACIYCLATGRKTCAVVVYALALSLKLQAIFLSPLLVILLVKREIAWQDCMFIPIVYVVTIIPAWLTGRGFFDLLTIYLAQTDFYVSLSMNAPNFYQWFPQSLHSDLSSVSLVLCGAVISAFCLFVSTRPARLTPDHLIRFATLSVLLVPFFLPRMHERYFYPADVLSIIFAFYLPRYFVVPLAVQIASLFSYIPFLFGRRLLPSSVLAAILFAALLLVAIDLVRTLSQGPVTSQSAPVSGLPSD